MPKKILITLLVFIVMGVFVFGIMRLTNQQSVALPERIAPDTPCPVVGCTQPDSGCHADGPYPEPDGVILMECPRDVGCTDSQCHAWDRIEMRRTSPNDASMNLWILAPVVLVLLLVGLVRKL